MLTNLRPARDGLLALARELESRPVDVYREFIDFMLADGVDALAGAPVSTVSSERFDHLTQCFVSDPVNQRRVLRLLRAFSLRKRRPHGVRGRLQRLGNRLLEAVEEVSLDPAPAGAFAEVFRR